MKIFGTMNVVMVDYEVTIHIERNEPIINVSIFDRDAQEHRGIKLAAATKEKSDELYRLICLLETHADESFDTIVRLIECNFTMVIKAGSK
jgi:hypothetical protein